MPLGSFARLHPPVFGFIRSLSRSITRRPSVAAVQHPVSPMATGAAVRPRAHREHRSGQADAEVYDFMSRTSHHRHHQINPRIRISRPLGIGLRPSLFTPFGFWGPLASIGFIRHREVVHRGRTPPHPEFAIRWLAVKAMTRVEFPTKTRDLSPEATADTPRPRVTSEVPRVADGDPEGLPYWSIGVPTIAGKFMLTSRWEPLDPGARR